MSALQKTAAQAQGKSANARERKTCVVDFTVAANTIERFRSAHPGISDRYHACHGLEQSLRIRSGCRGTELSSRLCAIWQQLRSGRTGTNLPQGLHILKRTVYCGRPVISVVSVGSVCGSMGVYGSEEPWAAERE